MSNQREEVGRYIFQTSDMELSPFAFHNLFLFSQKPYGSGTVMVLIFKMKTWRFTSRLYS